MSGISNGSLPHTPEQEKFLRHHFETLTDAHPEGRALPLSALLGHAIQCWAQCGRLWARAFPSRAGKGGEGIRFILTTELHNFLSLIQLLCVVC